MRFLADQNKNKHYLRLFKAIRFFKPLLPPPEFFCLEGLGVVVYETCDDVVDTAAVILSLMCSLILITSALSGVVGGEMVVVGLLCLLSSL